VTLVSRRAEMLIGHQGDLRIEAVDIAAMLHDLMSVQLRRNQPYPYFISPATVMRATVSSAKFCSETSRLPFQTLGQP